MAQDEEEAEDFDKEIQEVLAEEEIERYKNKSAQSKKPSIPKPKKEEEIEEEPFEELEEEAQRPMKRTPSIMRREETPMPRTAPKIREDPVKAYFPNKAYSFRNDSTDQGFASENASEVIIIMLADIINRLDRIENNQ